MENCQNINHDHLESRGCQTREWDYISSLNYTSEYRGRDNLNQYQTTHISSVHKSVVGYLGSANRHEVTVCVEKDHGSFELKPCTTYLKHWIIQSVQSFVMRMWSRQNLSRWITELFVRWIIFEKIIYEKTFCGVDHLQEDKMFSWPAMRAIWAPKNKAGLHKR